MHLERFAAIKLVLSNGLDAISSSSGASSVKSKYAPVNEWFPQIRFAISSSQFFTIRTEKLVSCDRKRFHFERAFCAYPVGCYTSRSFSDAAIQKSGFRAE